MKNGVQVEKNGVQVEKNDVQVEKNDYYKNDVQFQVEKKNRHSGANFPNNRDCS